MIPTVVIDCFPSSVERYLPAHAIIGVDVIRATTTAVTALDLGWRCFPVASLDDAINLRAQLGDCLLAGELGGNMPVSFDITNSPVALSARCDSHRRVVLLSTSGTELLCRAQQALAAYSACLRNFEATVAEVAARHERVAVIGAGSRGEFREEDEMCCAWIAERLLHSGFSAANETTLEIVARWTGRPADACLTSNSVKYLRRTGQLADLEFILHHINDLDYACTVAGGEAMKANSAVLMRAEE